jgi:hypothetical protein
MSKVKIIIGLIVFGFLFSVYEKCTGKDIERAKQKQIQQEQLEIAKQQAEDNYNKLPFFEKFKKTLSRWDGSYEPMKKAVKQSCNDPSSFEHVQTSYAPNNKNEVVCLMVYRAKNGFNALITKSIKFKVDSTWTSKIIEEN